jgi:hypothetical protein
LLAASNTFQFEFLNHFCITNGSLFLQELSALYDFRAFNLISPSSISYVIAGEV